jgi:hypothetical protein
MNKLRTDILVRGLLEERDQQGSDLGLEGEGFFEHIQIQSHWPTRHGLPSRETLLAKESFAKCKVKNGRERRIGNKEWCKSQVNLHNIIKTVIS